MWLIVIGCMIIGAIIKGLAGVVIGAIAGIAIYAVSVILAA